MKKDDALITSFAVIVHMSAGRASAPQLLSVRTMKTSGKSSSIFVQDKGRCPLAVAPSGYINPQCGLTAVPVRWSFWAKGTSLRGRRMDKHPVEADLLGGATRYQD